MGALVDRVVACPGGERQIGKVHFTNALQGWRFVAGCGVMVFCVYCLLSGSLFSSAVSSSVGAS